MYFIYYVRYSRLLIYIISFCNVYKKLYIFSITSILDKVQE